MADKPSARKRYSATQRSKRMLAGLCSSCGKKPANGKLTCSACLERVSKKRDALKAEAYAAYGGPVCACCSETEPAFLTLDHIANNGREDRKEGMWGHVWYIWLKKNSYPPGLQVLCMNCQWGKRLHGVCPHKTRAEKRASF